MKRYINLILCIFLIAPITYVQASEIDNTSQNSCNVNYTLEVIDDNTLKGTGNDGVDVEIYVNDTFLSTTKVQNNQYSEKLNPALEDGDKVKVVSEDNTLSLTYEQDGDNKESFDDDYQCIETDESEASIETKSDDEAESEEETPEEKDVPESKEEKLEIAEETPKVAARSAAVKQFEKGKCPTTKEYNEANSHLIGTVISKPIEGEVRCVETAHQFRQAVTNRNVEVILLNANISGLILETNRTNTDQKIYDGNGYSLDLLTGHLVNNSVSEITVKNFSNLMTTISNQNYGMFRSLYPSQLRLMDVTFNGSHIGASWESVLHVYGDVIINSNATYASFYRFYEIHDDAVFNVNSANNGLHAQSNKTQNIDLNGIRVGKNAQVNITANAGVALYSGGDYQKYVEAGPNSLLHLTSMKSHAVEFIDTKDFFITSHHDGEIILDSPNSPVKAGGIGTVTVDDHGSLIMNKTGATDEPIFSTSNQITFNIYYPKVVDFNNTNGPIFDAKDTTLKTINVSHTGLEGYKAQNVIPDYKTSALNGTFTMRNNKTDADNKITKVVPDFNTQFTSDLNRLKFVGDIEVDITVDEPVTDADTEVTGTTNPNRTIKMVNTRTNKVYNTKSDAEGNFSFKNIPDGDLKEKDKLKFSVIVDKYEIAATEVTVIGTILELQPVEDIVFEETEINNIREKVIHRKNNTHEIKVKSTRDSNFTVDVYSNTPLTHENNIDVLNNALYFVKNDEYKLIEGESNRQVIGSKEEAVKKGDNYTFTFDKNEGILIKTNPALAAKGDYKAELVWTLTDGP